MTALALFPLVVGVQVLEAAWGPIRDVDVAQLSDRSAVPPRTFVRFTATPSTSLPVYGEQPGTEESLLLVAEAPALVVWVHHEEQAPAIGAPATIEGEILDGGDYGGATGAHVPEVAVAQLAIDRLGLPDERRVRVVALGRTPGDLRFEAVLGIFGCGAPLLVVAGLAWASAFRVSTGTARRRR